MADERRAWIPRWARWLVLGLAALELAYVLGANSFLRHDWGRGLVNRKPDKLAVAWDSGWTWFPGLVHVRGLDLGGTSRRVAWQARMDRGTMLVWLPSLAVRHLHVLWGRPAGVEADVDLLPPPEEPRARRTKRGWRVTLRGLDLEDLRRVRVRGYELAGAGSARGRMSFQVRGPMELDFGRLRFTNARVTSGGAVVATGFEVDGGFDTAPYHPGQETVRDLLGGASGRARLAAHVENLGFLSAYLGAMPWLGLGGAGELELAVAVDDGSLLPGTTLSLTGPRVRADFFDFRAHGSGRVSGEVPAEGGEVRLGAVLDEYDVTRISDGVELLVGEGLETRFTTRTTTLRHPLAHAAGSLRLPPSRVASLAALGGYLPAGAAVRVSDGAATLAADLAYDTEAASGSGRLVVDATGVRGAFGDADFVGDVRIEAAMPHVDLLAGTFDVSGTGVTIGDARMARRGKERTRDWWGRIRVASGRIERRLLRGDAALAAAQPAVIIADVEGEMLDTAPLLVLMEQRLPKLAWFDRLLTIPEIALRGKVVLSDEGMGLYGVHVTGGQQDQLEIRAELDLAERTATGAVYARYRAIDAALALNDGDRDWRLRRAKQAYEEAAAAYRATRESEPLAAATASGGLP